VRGSSDDRPDGSQGQHEHDEPDGKVRRHASLLAYRDAAVSGRWANVSIVSIGLVHPGPVRHDRGCFLVGREKRMPHHWRPIKEGAGGNTRVTEVANEVVNAGGQLLFVGPEQNSNPERWFALVDVSGVGDTDAMWSNIGTKGPAKKFS
jgi:hypothetical protein